MEGIVSTLNLSLSGLQNNAVQYNAILELKRETNESLTTHLWVKLVKKGLQSLKHEFLRTSGFTN